MKKSFVRFICVILFFTALFLTAQVIIFYNVSKPGFQNVEKKTRKVLHENLSTKGNIKMFVDLCAIYKSYVALIDPIVLKAIVQRNVSNYHNGCKFLCYDAMITTFAILSHHWKPQVAFELSHNGFSVLKLEEIDPRMLSIKTSSTLTVPTHYFFTNNKHTIHLVLLYERTEEFLWHGTITEQQLNKSDIHHEIIRVGHYAGAFKRLDITKVVLDGMTLYMPRYPQKFLLELSSSRFIECNYDRAQQFYQKHPRENSIEAAKFRESAKDLIKKGKNCLDKIGVPFWLSSGTCLGWYRQCDLISYSKDVDFGIWIKNFKDSLIPVFERNSLPLLHKFGKVSDSLELSFKETDVKLDLFFFYEEIAFMWNGGTQVKTGKKFKYIFPRFSMCWTLFLEMFVRIPCETESYIEANYGKDWFTPVKQWDWKKSPPNVQENGHWPENELHEVIQLFN